MLYGMVVELVPLSRTQEGETNQNIEKAERLNRSTGGRERAALEVKRKRSQTYYKEGCSISVQGSPEPPAYGEPALGG